MTDGIWKLSYPVCLFKVPVYVEGMKVNLPDCCPMEPEKGKLFCNHHSTQLRRAGLPDDLLGFVKKIRKDMLTEVSDDKLTDQEYCALNEIIKRVGDSNTNNSLTTADAQG